MEEIQQALKSNINKFVEPTEKEWNDFISHWKPFKYPKNQIITDLGKVERYFYFVSNGVIRGYFIKDGLEHNMGFSYKGDFSGEYESFVLQQPANFAMEAITDVEGIKISHENLMRMYNEHKIFERWGRLFNEMILTGLGIFIRSMVADTAEDRFKRLMTQSPHVLQLIPQKHLASYLGMTPETFSRMRKKWMG